MKQIPILSGRCLVVELPEGANRFTVFNDARPYLSFFVSTETPRVYLPKGNWHIVGMLSEVTEEQADEIVSKVINGQHFQNYAFTSPVNRWVKTALESLDSAILAEGYVFENPYGEEPVRLPEGHNSHGTHESMWNQWKEGQSRVLDRSRCLLLGREQ